jgi:ABC-type amino acid transport substrate-binding protein
MNFSKLCLRLTATLLAATAIASPTIAQDVYKTGVDATFAPHAMRNLAGELEGFQIDLGKALADEMGVTIDIEGVENSALVPTLLSSRYDFLIAPVVVTPERTEQMLFTEGYIDTQFAFTVEAGTTGLDKPEDLAGKTIAVNKGSIYEQWAEANADKYGFKYDVYNTNADAVQAVSSGRADANMAILTVASFAAKQNPTVKVAFGIDSGLVTALAFRPDDTEGRALFSNAIKCLKLNGTIAELSQKWFGYTPAADAPAVTPAVGTGIVGLNGYDETPVTPVCR